ncbi:hypothetical protein N0B51_11830 [Tsuneonella sp. YG55]|uniref:Uncharacterized protein n=1 Tax=Tsuneonella litorea TaxID=2976475 RepID=A0A9X3ALE6_9SPHN|nr:hypothetical protein [Tsuneonella litorea]MCT2559669.1 hypothetical protein [Tsuneonella litorea]
MRHFSVIAALLAAALLAGESPAQSPEAPDPVDALKECRAITRDADRLACLDRVSSAIVAAAERGDVHIVTQKDVEETRRGLFGFSLPKLKLFETDREDGREPFDTLQSEVASARRLDARTYVFKITDGGATWQIKEAPARFVGPKPGDRVVFKRAALGSYFIRINDQVGVKGRRID